jgi:membrane protein involved in colicin uptake
MRAKADIRRLPRIYEFTRDAAEQAALPVPPSGDVYENMQSADARF